MLSDAETLARVAGDVVVRYVQEAIVTRGRAAVALSGGPTPRRLFELLARPPHRTRLDFASIHFFGVDERCVGPEHEQSNFRQANELLFAPAGVPGANVHRIRGELPPAQAAADYERQLRAFFGDGPPVFDLIHLGVGADGHTASLFADGPGLDATGEWAVASRSPIGVADRVTLTLGVLNVARQVMFFVSGSAKAGIVARVFAEAGPASPLPAGRVAPAPGGPLWLLDAAAAAR